MLISPSVRGDIFAHFSAIRDVSGYRSLSAGETVYFSWEPYPELQDGCPNRAVDVFATLGGPPVPPVPPPPGAFETSLTIEWDDDPPGN